MSARARLPMLTGWALSLALAAGARAQDRNLFQDLADLNVRLKTPHYGLAGSIDDVRLAEYGRCLEFVYGQYAEGFAELLEPSAARRRSTLADAPDSDDRFRVVILATEAQYNEFAAAYFGNRVEHTRGLFVPSAGLLVVRDDPDSAETYEVLFHEAFHQFVQRHVPLAPPWVNEGLATHYGTARPTPQGLALGRRRSDLITVVRRAAEARRLVPFEEVLLADAVEFYNKEEVPGLPCERVALNYAEAYTLVAYMLSDPGGQAHLQAYLRELAQARGADEVASITRRHFTPELLERLVEPWLAFVNR